MSEHNLSRADVVELTQYGPQDKITRLRNDAYDDVLAAWRADRPDDLDRLEAADDFAWDDLDFESVTRPDPDFEILTGIEPIRGDAGEIHDLAWSFVSDWIDAYCDRLRDLQDRSLFSRQVFRTYWLQASLSKKDLKQMFDVEYPTLSGYETRAEEDGIDRAEATLKLVYDGDPFDDE